VPEELERGGRTGHPSYRPDYTESAVSRQRIRSGPTTAESGKRLAQRAIHRLRPSFFTNVDGHCHNRVSIDRPQHDFVVLLRIDEEIVGDIPWVSLARAESMLVEVRLV
jgi:hypothetical protein